MKLKFITLLFAILGLLLVNVDSHRNLNRHKKNDEKKQDQRPNLGDIVKHLEHPFYEKEFVPTEVQSLAAILPKPPSIYDMASAEILGDNKDNKQDLDQKPTLYSTIVTSHATSVIHPTKAIGKPNIIADSAVSDQFGALGKTLPPGSFSSKVQIGDLNLDEKGFGAMEKPVFISKGQKKIENKANDKIPIVGKSAPISNSVLQASQMDTKAIKQHLAGLKSEDREKKLNALIKAKKMLEKEGNNLRKEIQNQTSSLLTAKSASLTLTSVLSKYEERLKKDKLAHLKLADRVEVKKALKDKLIKEIEGFRTRPSEYKSLINVDKDTIKQVVADVQRQLGN